MEFLYEPCSSALPKPAVFAVLASRPPSACSWMCQHRNRAIRSLVKASGGDERKVRPLWRGHRPERKPSRPAGDAADQVGTLRQSQDCQGARPHSAADHANDRRRGDRMTGFLLRCMNPLVADFVAKVPK